MATSFYNTFRYYLIALLLVPLFTNCIQREDPDGPGFEQDNYIGEFRKFELGQELDGFTEEDIICHIRTSAGHIIKRAATHKRNKKGVSSITMVNGLRAGTYRLLFFEYGDGKSLGLGGRITFQGDSYTIVDKYDSSAGFVGSGTYDDPYIISAANHLSILREYTNTHSTEGIYFRQESDIDAKYMKTEVTQCDPVHFWTPIGYDNNNPFSGVYDGNNHYIEYVKSIGDPYIRGFALGLFGYLRGAMIINLTIQNSYVKGSYGVGALAGAVISRAGGADTTNIHNCTVFSSEVYGFDGSMTAGGLVGVVDSRTVLSMANCESKASFIKTDYNAGGLIGAGAQNSSILVNLCRNSSEVTVLKGSAGGIIAVADTINITSSQNLSDAKVSGPESNIDDTQRAIGGIIGGARAAWITGCENLGTINGYEGVGGIIGSTRAGFDEDNGYQFFNVYLRYCKNSGKVSGTRHIGGLSGESQFGCFGSINAGEVSGTEYVGGFVGNASVAAIHNSVNNGKVTGTGNYVSGMVAITNMGIIANAQNFADVSGGGLYTGGLVGYAVNNTIVHYGANYGKVSGAESPVGGIVASMGKAGELSWLNMAEIAFGIAQVAAGVIIGPMLTVAHHVVGGTKGLACILVEVGIHLVVSSIEVAFIGIAGHHMDHPHMHVIKTELLKTVEEDINRINSEIKTLRESQKVTLHEELSQEVIDKHYTQNIDSLTNYLQVESQVSQFNNDLNEALRVRGMDISEINEDKERVYIIASSLMLVTEIVALIAVSAISGGAAAPAAVSIIMSLAGATNSIIKGSTDYQDNITMVSQCANFGEIAGADNSLVGGIVGEFHSRGYISNCLNAGKGPGGTSGQLVGAIDDDYYAADCLCIADRSTWGNTFGSIDKGTSKYDTLEGIYVLKNGSGNASHADDLSISDLSSSSSFSGWSIGEYEPWIIPETGSDSSTTFPIPNRSFPVPSH